MTFLPSPRKFLQNSRNDESSLEQKQWSRAEVAENIKLFLSPVIFLILLCDCSARRASRWNYRLDAHPILLKHIISSSAISILTGVLMPILVFSVCNLLLCYTEKKLKIPLTCAGSLFLYRIHCFIISGNFTGKSTMLSVVSPHY